MRRALVLFSLMVTHLVVSGSGVKAASDPRAAQLTYEPWGKSCIAQTCFVATGARGACYPSGGVLSIIVSDDKNASLSANLATKRPLEGVVSIQIDKSDPILISQPKCYGLSCGGKFEINGEFIERLKHSQTITIEATDTAHQKISLSLSLAGFAKAYDEPGTQPKVREELLSSQEMKELMQRSEEEKRARECQE